MESFVVLGSGGHAKVVIDAIKTMGYSIEGITSAEGQGFCMDIPVLGTDDILGELYESGIRNAAMGIGNVGNTVIRNRVFEHATQIGFAFPPIIHKSAVVAGSAKIMDGTVVAAGALINPDAYVGRLAIINTGAVIEHEAVIGDGVHVAPNATILGGAVVGDNTFCGGGCVVLPFVKVGKNCIIGAGSVVRENIPDGQVVAGVPGRIIRSRDM